MLPSCCLCVDAYGLRHGKHPANKLRLVPDVFAVRLRSQASIWNAPGFYFCFSSVVCLVLL